jgi:hypothetical protein
MPRTQFPRLSKQLASAAAALERASESVRAVMNGEQNRFSRALAALARLADTEGIPIRASLLFNLRGRTVRRTPRPKRPQAPYSPVACAPG